MLPQDDKLRNNHPLLTPLNEHKVRPYAATNVRAYFNKPLRDTAKPLAGKIMRLNLSLP
jgi:hypothetical protein